MNKIIASLFLFCSTLDAAPSDYFKAAGGKEGFQSLGKIDFIYMINLDERSEKHLDCLQQLAPYGIVPYRFSAVNGWKLPLEVINDIGVCYESWMESKPGTCYLPDDEGIPLNEVVEIPGRNYFCRGMTRGAIGIVMSHLSILQDAYDSGYNTIWVMEDDIEIIKDPRLLPAAIDELDKLVGSEGWDILFTDRETKGQDGNYVQCLSYAWRPNFTPENPSRFCEKEDTGANFRKVGARYGAYSMVIRRSGMKKLLDFFASYRIYLPFDMDFYLPGDIKLFTVVEDIVSTHPQALSDNSNPNYLRPEALRLH